MLRTRDYRYTDWRGRKPHRALKVAFILYAILLIGAMSIDLDVLLLWIMSR
jgi:hypothetical protein